MGITLAQAQEILDNALTALNDVLTKGVSYKIGDREFTRADIPELESLIARWEQRVSTLSSSSSSNTGIRIIQGTDYAR